MDEYDFYESLNRLYYNDKKRRTPSRNTRFLSTYDNFGVEFMRELSVMRIKFPFLTELQLQGRTLTKFGIPNIMGKPYETKKGGSLKFYAMSNVIHRSRKSLSERKLGIENFNRRHTIAGTYVPLDVRNTKYKMKNSRIVKNLYNEFTLYSEDNDRYSIDPATSPEIKSQNISEGSQFSDLNFSIDSESPEMVKPVKTYKKRKSFDNNRNYISNKGAQNMRECDTDLARMLREIDKPMRPEGRFCINSQRSGGNHDGIKEINHLNAKKASNQIKEMNQELNKMPSRKNEHKKPMTLELQNKRDIPSEGNVIDAEKRQGFDLNGSRLTGGRLSTQSDGYLSIDYGEFKNLETQETVSDDEIIVIEPSEESINVNESSLVEKIRQNFKQIQLSSRNRKGNESQSDIEPTPSSRLSKKNSINLNQDFPVKKIKQSMSMVSIEYLEKINTVFIDRYNSINREGLNLNIEYLFGVECLPTPNFEKRMMKLMDHSVLPHSKVLQQVRLEEDSQSEKSDTENYRSKVKKYRKSSVNVIETIEDQETIYSEDSTYNEEYSDLDEYEDNEKSPERRRKSSRSSVEGDFSRNEQTFSPNQIQPNLSRDGSTSPSSQDESDGREHADSEEENDGSGVQRGHFSPRIFSFENHTEVSSIASTLGISQNGDELPSEANEGHSADTMDPINDQVTDDGYFLANLFDDHNSQPQRRTLRSTSMREIPSNQENDDALTVE